MKIQRLALVMALAAMVSLASLPAAAAEYDFDMAHCNIGFQVKHMAISKVSGKFDKYDGNFNFEPGKPEMWSTVVTIDAASINTDNERRDDHLRSGDFFETAKYPTITFKSTGVTMTDATEGTVTGDLTMHGVTRPVTLDLEFLGTVTDPWGHEKAGFSLSGKINRQDWGLNWNKALETGGLIVSDTVKLMIDIEGNKAD